jgi:nucleotide-binding universal stress UspA family protein
MEPVVVIANDSPWDEEADQWARAHAELVDATVETHRAEDHFHAQLVVLGYQSRSKSPLGLGGHVLPLVGAMDCDTVVVRGTTQARNGRHGRVTALVSGGPDDSMVLASAVRFARRHRALLRMLHAAPLSPLRADLDSDHSWVLEQAEQALGGFPHTAVLVRRQPHEAISRSLDSDLLVVGPGETHEYGSVTRAALHHAPCPVLVVHRPVQEEHRGTSSVPAPRRPVRTTV